jgi:hypothetical protein
MKSILLVMAVAFAFDSTLANAVQPDFSTISTSSPYKDQKGIQFERRKTEYLKYMFERKEQIEKVLLCVEEATNQEALQACKHMMQKR